ncbi:MAG: hypothetical protein RL565_809 [Pseudomonadota bacterium]|jgi:uncharacterized protein (DUF4415 family)
MDKELKQFGDDLIASIQEAKTGTYAASHSPATITKRMRGRPALEAKRPVLNMRIDAEVLDAIKSNGRGWQTKLNQFLRSQAEQLKRL